MYGVVEIAGHQYRVEAGDIIDVEKLAQEVGATVEFDRVFIRLGENLPKLGAPTVEGAKVTAKVIRQDRSRKQLIFKRKPGMYRRKNGHRQHYTGLLVTELSDGQGKIDKIDNKSKNAEKFLK